MSALLQGQGLPPSLKPIATYLQRAREIAPRDPVVAYYARLYALQLALDLRQTMAKEDMAVLLELMDAMEQEKLMVDLSAVDVPSVHVENFAQDLFTRADEADRRGTSDMKVGRAFFAASVVIDVCRQFGDLALDLQEKHKYARWRFVEISKAFKEGRAPAPPPDVGSLDFLNLPHPGPDADEDTAVHDRATGLPPDGTAPRAPPPTAPTLDADPARDAPATTTAPGGTALSPPAHPSAHQPSHQHTGATPPGPPVYPPHDPAHGGHPPRPHAPWPGGSTPPAPTGGPQPPFAPPPMGGAGRGILPVALPPSTTSNLGPPPPVPGPGPQATVSADALYAAQRHAKYAVSALQFSDVPTAVQNLRQALAVLSGRASQSH